MTIYCTIKRPAWDTCRATEYEIVKENAFTVELRKAHPGWTETPVVFTESKQNLAVVWEVKPEYPEVDTDAHEWANEIVDEEWRPQ